MKLVKFYNQKIMKSVYTELRFTGIYSIINPERGGGKKTAAISQTVQYMHFTQS